MLFPPDQLRILRIMEDFHSLIYYNIVALNKQSKLPLVVSVEKFVLFSPQNTKKVAWGPSYTSHQGGFSKSILSDAMMSATAQLRSTITRRASSSCFLVGRMAGTAAMVVERRKEPSLPATPALLTPCTICAIGPRRDPSTHLSSRPCAPSQPCT